MNIAVAGGTGFVGKALTTKLRQEGHQVFVLTRHPKRYDNQDITYIKWLGKNDHPEKQLPKLDAIVNLAGESLNSGRWTVERKKRILNSRLKTTGAIIALIDKLEEKPTALINASAVGYYGTSEENIYTEETKTPGTDFLADVVSQWEATAQQAEQYTVRTVFLRFGVILGEEGALPKMAVPFQLYAGGKVGSGEQWLSWIHIDDVVGLILFSILNNQASGPINATAPNPKRNRDFGKLLAKVLKRPFWLPAPTLMLNLLLGEMSMLLLQGQYVLPRKAQELGYKFIYPELTPALESIFIKERKDNK